MNPNNPNYNPANSKSPDVTPVLPNPALNPNANYNYNPANSQSPLVTPVNNMVVGSGPANMEFANYSANLSKALGALNPTQAKPKGPEITIENVGTDDPYGQMLQSISNSANASTKALIASIQASRANQANTINSQYDNYKKGLQLLGIQHNDAQSTPDLLMGHIKQAENEQNAKIQALDIEEKKLLMDAETAQKNNDLETLKAKMDRVKQIKEEKNQALKDISDQLTAETSIAENQAHVIYETLNTLSENEKEIFLQQVAKKYNIPLGTLVTALADEKTETN
jgi:predicted DNA-binding ribbon-helix-helix protein